MFGGRSLVVGVLLGLLGVGCDEVQQVHIASATDAARANELAATADYRGQRLRTEGIVAQVGLKRVERESATSTPNVWGSPYGSRDIEIHHYNVGYPYLYAQDAQQRAGGGRVLCFFDPELMKKVGRLQPGALVALEGQFQQFTDHGSTMVLRDCELN